MPEEAVWDAFFDPPQVLDRLQFGLHRVGPVVEFGCGYGTFTIPAAQRCAGVVHALDIEPEMVALTMRKAWAAGLVNVHAEVRDFVSQGVALAGAAADYCMVFNILHTEQPVHLLREARRVLKPGGLLGVMHWNYDPATPRGPSLAIRPRPDQCRQWAIDAGFQPTSDLIDLPPHHYGFVFEQPA
jgi:SAM-dependent methyltransferase